VDIAHLQAHNRVLGGATAAPLPPPPPPPRVRACARSRGDGPGAMFFSLPLSVVFRTTGGRIWNKRWGLPRLTRTRKENRRTDVRIYNNNMNVLKAAEALQPEIPVRLLQPLPDWQCKRMATRLALARRLLNLQGTLLSREAAEEQMRRAVTPQRPGPGVDPPSEEELAALRAALAPPTDPQAAQHLVGRRLPSPPRAPKHVR
jgi:hypothetical protein